MKLINYFFIFYFFLFDIFIFINRSCFPKSNSSSSGTGGHGNNNSSGGQHSKPRGNSSSGGQQQNNGIVQAQIHARAVYNLLDSIFQTISKFIKNIQNATIIEKVLSILQIQINYFKVIQGWLNLQEIQQIKNSLIEIKVSIDQLGIENDKSQVLSMIAQLESLINFTQTIPGQEQNMQTQLLQQQNMQTQLLQQQNMQTQQLQQQNMQTQQLQQTTQQQFGQMSYNINNEQEFISIMNNLLAAGGAKGIILLNYREFVNSWDNQFVVLIKKLLEDPNIVNSYLLPNKIYVFYLNSFVQSAQDLAIKINLADKSGNHPVMYGISFSGMQQLMASNLNSLKLNQINNAGQVPSINDFYNKIKSIFQI